MCLIQWVVKRSVHLHLDWRKMITHKKRLHVLQTTRSLPGQKHFLRNSCYFSPCLRRQLPVMKTKCPKSAFGYLLFVSRYQNNILFLCLIIFYITSNIIQSRIFFILDSLLFIQIHSFSSTFFVKVLRTDCITLIFKTP